MKILAICGAKQKNRNTAEMLKAAYEGALSVGGAEGEFVWLYDLDYNGCSGCHACKVKGGVSFAKCAMRDDLTPVLEKAIEADVILLGSPMYFGDVTGNIRQFIERFYFPGITYNMPKPGEGRVPTYPKKCKMGWVFTMNAPGDFYKSYFEQQMNTALVVAEKSEYVMAWGTQQFEDYDKYEASMFDVPTVKQRHIEQFPKDCEAAYEMGKRLAGG